MAGPVEGIKVVELGVWVAGPAAGGILADWGADAPFGGYKMSGIGRQNGIEGFEQHLQTKTIGYPL